jgi:restriction endonuclease Mrr
MNPHLQSGERNRRQILAGVITTLTDRGYGFIQPDAEDLTSIFFHSKDLCGVAFDDLKCADLVTFQLAEGEKGPQAQLVSRAGETPEVTTHHELTSKPPAVVVRALQECNAELLEYVTKNPHYLRDVHPGTFENIVEAIYSHEGFTTERISGWNEPDGGVDLMAIRYVSPGCDIRLAIQCKRWAQSRKLSAEPLRSLAGVLDRFRAHAGVVATTGFFSDEAREEMTSYLWRISVRDYVNILASLKRLKLTR